MILNMTQHDATEEQVFAGVFNAPEQYKDRIRGLLTFNELPNEYVLCDRADKLVEIAKEISEGKVMIGGAPFFMAILQTRLTQGGFTPVYAFSVRKSVDEVQADGSVKKTSVFAHEGFVKAIS